MNTENTYLGRTPSQMSKEELIELVNGIQAHFDYANKSALCGGDAILSLEQGADVKDVIAKYHEQHKTFKTW